MVQISDLHYEGWLLDCTTQSWRGTNMVLWDLLYVKDFSIIHKHLKKIQKPGKNLISKNWLSNKADFPVFCKKNVEDEFLGLFAPSGKL